MKHAVILSMALSLFVMLFMSCDSETSSSELPVTDIAVLHSVGEGRTVFAVNSVESVGAEYKEWHNELDTTEVKVGNAMLIRYVDSRVDNRVELIGYSLFSNLVVKVDDSDKLGDWNRTPVYLQSYTVVDRHLIIHAKLPYSNMKRRLSLLIDRNTLCDEVPSGYIIHELTDDEPTFDRSYYLSFDLSAICVQYGIKQLKVMVNNSNLPIDNIIINLK